MSSLCDTDEPSELSQTPDERAKGRRDVVRPDMHQADAWDGRLRSGRRRFRPNKRRRRPAHTTTVISASRDGQAFIGSYLSQLSREQKLLLGSAAAKSLARRGERAARERRGISERAGPGIGLVDPRG